MKPFDIEKAKKGAPVCTRDGRPVRIVAWDRKGFYPIVAIVKPIDKHAYVEEVLCYANNGRYSLPLGETVNDLMMAPEKHEGWVNIYKDRDNSRQVGDVCIYMTEEDAKKKCCADAITTIKIEWEE